MLLIGNFLTESVGTRHVSEDLADHLERRGWSLIRASKYRGRLRRGLDMLLTTWQRRHGYDIAHVEVYSGLAFGWAEAVGWLLRRLGKPCLLTLHGGNLPTFALRWPRRVARLLGGAAVVTAPSGYLAERMSRFSNQVIVIPNAIDVVAYPFRERARPSPRLVWLRAFDHLYNPVLAVEALALLAPRFPEVSLTMIGPDKLDGSLDETRRVAKRLGVADRLEFPGTITKAEIPVQLDRADIFLNTTNADNNPVSVIEAMACGLCVVSTTVGGIPWLLEDERTALLVPPGNAAALATAIGRLLEDPQLAGRLSREARLEAERRDREPIIGIWERLIISTARTGSPCSGSSKSVISKEPI